MWTLSQVLMLYYTELDRAVTTRWDKVRAVTGEQGERSRAFQRYGYQPYLLACDTAGRKHTSFANCVTTCSVVY